MSNSGIDRGLANPFLDWWKTDDGEWIAQRKKQWPFVKRHLLRKVNHVSRAMPQLRKYFLYGDVAVHPDPPGIWESRHPGQPLPMYLGTLPRLILMPWSTSTQIRTVIDTYVYPQYRQGSGHHVFDCGIAAALNLPLVAVDDDGFKRLDQAAAALYPESFSDALCGKDQFLGSYKDPVEGAVGYIGDFELRVRQFLEGATDIDNQPLRINPSPIIVGFYFSCFEYLEHQGLKTFERRRGYQSCPDRFLLDTMRFEERFPNADERDARRHLALAIRERMNKPDAPADLSSRLPEVQKTAVEPIRLKKARPNPFGHIKFYRGGGKLQYVARESADSDFEVAAGLVFEDEAQRDRVLRIVGEPGRPADEEDADASDLDVFRAIESLPLPDKVRCSDDTSIHLEWWYWEDEHLTLEPLFDSIRSLSPVDAIVLTRELRDAPSTELLHIQDGEPVSIDKHPSPVFEHSCKWFGI